MAMLITATLLHHCFLNAFFSWGYYKFNLKGLVVKSVTKVVNCSNLYALSNLKNEFE